MPIFEEIATEKWKLENDGAKFLFKKAHRIQKFVPLSIAIDEDLVVRDRLGYFHREDEIVRRLGEPAAHRFRRWTSIESRVHFNGVEAVCVIRQIVRRLQSTRIERALPAGRGERGGSEMNRGCHGREYSGRFLFSV